MQCVLLSVCCDVVCMSIPVFNFSDEVIILTVENTTGGCDGCLRQYQCKKQQASCDTWEDGIAQWLERWSRDQKVSGLSHSRSGGRIFFSRVNFLCRVSFWSPFHPNVTAAACKKSWSFCQKCRWQVTTEHACTLCMWLCMKGHDMVHSCMVSTEHTEMAAVSHGTSHVAIKSAVSTPLWRIFKSTP